jgi:Zn-dependent protease
MLRFALLKIPVAVHWSFALIGILVIGVYEPAEVVGWIVGVLLAVLFHEMGHALTARGFGAHPVKITLFGLGGVTTYPADTPLTPGRRFLIAASGSAVGMTLGGLLFLARNTDPIAGLFPFGRALASGFILAGLLWGALNWLPILPLDGGNMAWHALEFVTPRYALRIAKGLTIVTAAVIAYVAIDLWDNTFGAVFVAIIASQGLRIPEPGSKPKPRPQPSREDEADLLSIFDQPKDNGDQPHER